MPAFSAGVDLGGTNTLRELAGAVALELLTRFSLNDWLQFNRTLEMFVGPPDSLNFEQLHDLLVAAGIPSSPHSPCPARPLYGICKADSCPAN
jgi:hypothetical protein